MPEMDGYELARCVRQSYSQKLPIIAASASVSLADQSLAIAAGCDDFLDKPLDLEKLLNKLQKYLNLQWIYEDQPTAKPPILEIIYPHQKEIEAIYRAAKIGDIETIEREAHRLKIDHPHYTGFCDRLLTLASEFDERGIVELLAKI